MEIEKFERIESILSFPSVSNLTEAIDNIADQMIADGFEYSDVKEYINVYMNEILGK